MNLINIPEELKTLKQWVCSRGDSKVPMIAKSCFAASSTNPDTWSTFQDAVDSIGCGLYDHIGFVFNDNGIVGVDIDTGFDEDGFLTDIASDIIGRCKSYTEKSKSGRGFHILMKGDLPFKGKNNLKGVEIYKASRYFITTGDTILYNAIVENQNAIDYVIEKYFPNVRQKSETSGEIFENRIYTPIWEKPQGGKINLRPIYPKIPDGSRNICLTSLAGSLHSTGYSVRQIYDELLYCNKVACEPLLSDYEIRNIVSSVTKYKR